MTRLFAIALAIILSSEAGAVYGGGDKLSADADAYAGARAGAAAEGKGFGTGYGGDGGQAISGPSSSSSRTGSAIAGNGDQMLTNVYQNHYQYRAPFMDSNTLLMNSAGCKTFLGFQFSGANDDGAGGVGMGVPIDDEDCKLDKATRLAWAGGNTKLGWESYCSQPIILKTRGHILKMQGVKPRAERHRQAYTDCMAGAVDWKATLNSIQVEIEELTALLVEVAERPGFDDSAIRARLRLLESAAHRPRTTDLLIPEQHEE